MESQNPDSYVRLDPEPDEFGMRRAFVSIVPTQKDKELWNAMDKAADEVAWIFANGGPLEVLTPNGVKVVSVPDKLPEVFPYSSRRDSLGTTHHEAGPLWMGDNPARSVTNPDGRFHFVNNAYVAGPALFPTIGSPNPMLTGVALARRTAERILQKLDPPALEPGFTSLFDGSRESFQQWQMTGQGVFSLVDDTIVTQPGGDLGLLYFTPYTFADFVLRFQFRLNRLDDNSGIFVRFRDPRLPVPDRVNPHISYPYDNQAWVPVTTGFEVQIDELARGNPDGQDMHRTAAIYGVPVGTAPGRQSYQRGPFLRTGEWYNMEIKVVGDTYTVSLNGQQTTSFANDDPLRGQSPELYPHTGYIGLQSHSGNVAFRSIRILAAGRTLQNAFGLEAKQAAEEMA
jgi:hypothetical protein